MKKAPKIVNDRPRGGGRVGLPTQAYSQDNRDAYRREKDANVGAGEATGYSSNLEFISKILSLISKKIRSVFISCIPNYRATSPSVELDEASNRQLPVLPHWKPTSNKGDSIKNANVLAPVIVSIETCSTGSLVFHLLYQQENRIIKLKFLIVECRVCSTSKE